MVEKGFRQGIDKKEMLSATKQNQVIMDFFKSLTKEEIVRLKEARKFDEIKPGTITYKIALYLDSLRINMRTHKSTIMKRLWNLQNINDNTRRLRDQLESGKITEQLKDGMTMNKYEVKTELVHQEWVAIGEAEAIPQTLGELRGLVGHFDVVKQVIMTEEQFNEYAIGIIKKLRELGHEVLS